MCHINSWHTVNTRFIGDLVSRKMPSAYVFPEYPVFQLGKVAVSKDGYTGRFAKKRHLRFDLLVVVEGCVFAVEIDDMAHKGTKRTLSDTVKADWVKKFSIPTLVLPVRKGPSNWKAWVRKEVLRFMGERVGLDIAGRCLL